MAADRKARLIRILLLATRVLLGAIFLYAAYTKLRQPWQLFAMSINSYQLLPEQAAIFVARTLPGFELLLGVLLILGFQLRWVAGAASALLLFFLGVMIRAFIQGQGIDCGCFGVGEALSTKTLVRDGVLTAMSLVLTVAAFVQARRARALVHAAASE